MKCRRCIWYESGKCLLYGRTRLICPSYNKVPKMLLKYAKGVSQITSLDYGTIIKSEPFRNLMKRMRMVRV